MPVMILRSGKCLWRTFNGLPLSKNLPYDWKELRRFLGFAAFVPPAVRRMVLWRRRAPKSRLSLAPRHWNSLAFLVFVRTGTFLGRAIRPVEHRRAEVGDNPAPHGFGLCVNRRQEVAQRSSQSMQLIDQIENHRNSLVVDAEAL